MKRFLIYYRLLLIILVILFFILLFHKNLAPEGRMFLVKDFCLESKFISDLYPEERAKPVEKNGDKCYQTFFNQPVYFKVKVPRVFTQAKVKLVYRNARQNVVQFGVLRTKHQTTDWDFQLKLIENKIFDSLDWYKIEEEGVILWQKKKRFNSIHQFLNNLPMDQKAAAFFYEIVPEAIGDKTKVIKWNKDTPLKYVDYIIASYAQPLKKGDKVESEVEFLVGQDFINQGALEFMISAPGIEDDRYEISVEKIEIELAGPALSASNFWQKVKEYFVRKIRKDE